ncbi:MAG TPA: hypothetical protein VG096_26555 [Bryobacteraceae bacterium]|jgi:hypothetical protein|nr:hypothetical protein [Bryobacteraceae bacterium]
MDENAPIPVVDKPGDGRVEVEFEKKDFSIGTARYKGARPITKNLSMKPGGRGQPATPMCHANVEVRLFDDKGRRVSMSRRLVRTWDIQPLPGATVDNLRMWRIIGLEHKEYMPFSPFPLPDERPVPSDTNFKWDNPGRFDAQGLNSLQPTPFGILQEFLAGNRSAGGAYFQTYTLFDGSQCRTINSTAFKLSAADYGRLLDAIDRGAYTKQFLRRLYFMPSGSTNDISDLPQQSGADGGTR